MKKIVVVFLLCSMIMSLAVPILGAEADPPLPTVEEIVVLMTAANSLVEIY